jgi:hypothetical protein
VAGCAVAMAWVSTAEAGMALGVGAGAVKRRQTKASQGVLAPGYTFGPWETPSGLVNLRFGLSPKLALQFDASAYEYKDAYTTELWSAGGKVQTISLTDKTRFYRATANLLYVIQKKRFDIAIGGGGGMYGIEWIPDETYGTVDAENKGLQQKLGIQALCELDFKLSPGMRLFTSLSWEVMQAQQEIDPSHNPKMARVHVGLRFGSGSKSR